MSVTNKSHPPQHDDGVRPIDAATHAVLVRIAIALEHLVDTRPVPGAVPAGADEQKKRDLLDLGCVAEHLGVSKRWVQRRLTPTLRSGPRGRAWYRVEDVERQLASRVPVVIESTKKRSKPKNPAKTSMPRSQPEAEIAEVERRLRASMAKPTRRSR